MGEAMSKPQKISEQITKEELDTLDYFESAEYVDGHSADRDLQYYLPL